MLLFMKPDVVAEKERYIIAEVNCEQSKNWLKSGMMTTDRSTKRALKTVLNNKCRQGNSIGSQSMFENHHCLPTATVVHK